MINSDGDTETVTVCDWYSANAKRWTLLDPARSIYAAQLGDWADRAIIGGIALFVTITIWRSRREEAAKRLHEQTMRDYYASSE